MRLSKNDWLNLGIAGLANEGPGGLTIEAVCKRAGKTRGSFYHHFASTPQFIEQLANWWLQKYTVDLIEKSERHAHLSQKMDHLNALAVRLDPKIEQAFRRLAANNETAAKIVAKVDEMRVAYLARLYAQSSRYDERQAKNLAKIEYAAFVGMQQISPKVEPEEMLEIYRDFLSLTGRS